MVDHIRVSENVLFLVIVIMTQFEQFSQTQVNRWTAVTVCINVSITSTVLFFFFKIFCSVNNDAYTQQFRQDTQQVHSQYTQHVHSQGTQHVHSQYTVISTTSLSC